MCLRCGLVLGSGSLKSIDMILAIYIYYIGYYHNLCIRLVYFIDYMGIVDILKCWIMSDMDDMHDMHDMYYDEYSLF